MSRRLSGSPPQKHRERLIVGCVIMVSSAAAAATATATYVVVAHQIGRGRDSAEFPIGGIHFPKKNGRFGMRRKCSSEGVESEPAVVEVEEGPPPPPSLISALNVDRALRGIAITDVDHYARLGLQRGCTYDQVTMAYKKKVEELTKEEEELELDQLKESYSILSSVEERRLYDWSLARTQNPDRYTWPFQVDLTQTPKGTPPPREAEDVGPTRWVGYFILGWFVLSIGLSILLNQ